MKKSMSGSKYKPYKFKDWSHRQAFGAAPLQTITPLDNDVSNVPLVYQGKTQGCVPATITWAKSVLEVAHPKLSWEWLALVGKVGSDGSVPGDILDIARKKGIAEDIQGTNAGSHKIGGYFYVDLSPHEIYNALKKSKVLAIGVKDFQGSGPHFMCAYDVTVDGDLKCKNWWSPVAQEDVIVKMSDLIECIAFGEPPAGVLNLRFGMFAVLLDKLLAQGMKKLSAALLTLLALLGVPLASLQTPNEQPEKFGASGIYDKYAPVVGGAGISSTDTFLPVSTLSLYTGETITSASTTFPVYFIVNPNDNANREKIECNALDSSNSKWTSCYRGLSAICNNATSTVTGAAYAHSAGQQIIMSNDSCFFNRFLDVNTDQTASGTKTFSVGDIKLGDNTTTTSKFIHFPVGQSNSPYFKVVGPTGINTTSSFFFSLDGTSDLQLNTGGTTVGVSSTGGLFLTNGQFGIDASSTGALAFDSNYKPYVGVSSTASVNGGYLKQNTTLNKIYWDVVSFLTGSWTWSGGQTFSGSNVISGNTTATRVFAVQTPTSTMDAANKQYTDLRIANNSATGTAGMAITAGNALYISSTSTLWQTSTSVASSTFQFVGIAEATVAVGAEVRYTKPGGINCNQSSLAPGFAQFLNGTAGQISSTPGTFVARIGLATNATCVQVTTPKYVRTGQATFAAGVTTPAFSEVGFYPAHLTLRMTTQGSGAVVSGISISDESGGVYFPGSLEQAAAYTVGANAWTTKNSEPATHDGAISKSATGFTATPATNSRGTTINWIAESL